jgi:hypothetical protein
VELPPAFFVERGLGVDCPRDPFDGRDRAHSRQMDRPPARRTVQPGRRRVCLDLARAGKTAELIHGAIMREDTLALVGALVLDPGASNALGGVT